MKKKVIILAAAAIATANLMAAPTIWLIGDSTVASYSKHFEPLAGWGQLLHVYCKPGIEVKNHAKSGRSTKSFIAEKRWDTVIAGLEKGDFLLIQFGHNDQKKTRPNVSAPADGLYKKLLKKFISETKAKGAHPILVTPVMRRVFDEKGKLRNSLGGYPNAMKAVAKDTGTPLIDLNQIMFDKMLPMSKDESKKLYNHCPPGKYKKWIKGRVDNSHFNEYGAKIVSGWLVDDAKKQKLPVGKLFK
jgi:DNA sulfur modification protein DndE